MRTMMGVVLAVLLHWGSRGRATGNISNMEAASAAFSFAPAASRYLSRCVAPRPLVQALRNNVLGQAPARAYITLRSVGR
jgi:hypothetical protein